METIEPGVLTICTYSGFAPVCGTRDDGRTPWGTDVSFLEKFAAEHHLKTRWKVLNEFEGIWQEPGKNSCDIAGAGITPTDKRKEEAVRTEWSCEYFHVRRSFLIRCADSGIFRTIADFKGKTVAVTKNSTADVDIQVRNPASATVVYFSDQREAIDALLNGRIDAFGEGDVSNEYLAAVNRGLVVIDRHDMQLGISEPFAFPVRAGAGIVEALNLWLSTRTEAEYRDIEELKPHRSE